MPLVVYYNLVVACDVATAPFKIILLNPDATWDATTRNNPIWSWKAADSPQIASAHLSWFGKPLEAKLKDGGKTLLVVSDAPNGVTNPIGAGREAVVSSLSNWERIVFARSILLRLKAATTGTSQELITDRH